MGLIDILFGKKGEKNPKDPIIWLNRGNDFKKYNKYYEALECYNEALKLNPNFAPALFNKGIILKNMGRNEEALGWLDKGLDINPRSLLWYTKGSILDDLGRHHEALSCYKKK